MLKKFMAFFLLFPVSFIFGACGEGGEIKENSGNQTPELVLTPQPVLAPEPVLTPKPYQHEAKGAGFEYDEDNLTYELVWSDEFDYEGPPDPEKWSCETGGHGWGNNELQYYTKGENVYVDGGKMIIEARREESNGREVTSTRIRTANKGDWLYGKVEVSAKIPKGLGTWPAIWMLPTDWSYGNWPASGEIDIMEHVGYDENVLVTSIHTAAYNHSIRTQKGKSVKREGMTDGFHAYSIEWLPDKIKFFFDDELQFTYNPSVLKPNFSYKEWPFDKRFHLLINLAFGGNWGGARGVDYDALPVTYEIEYVRVYQSPEINSLKNKGALQ